MDDVLYWQGIPVGCVERGIIVWFSNATAEIRAALS